MRTLPPLLAASLAVLSAAPLGGCKKGEDKKADTKETKADTKETKADEGEPSLKVAGNEIAVDGPVPPDTSMVFYGIEGALLPLACFDKDKKKMESGRACLDMVKPGTEVRLSAIDSAFAKKVGDKVEPQCMAGSGKKVALGVEGITEGADFVFAAWPPSALKIVKPVSDDTIKPANTQLDDDHKAKLLAAIQADASGVKGDVTGHQVAKIALEGDKATDEVYSVFIPDPATPQQYLWSGIFLARGGDLDHLELLEKSKTKRDVFEVRGTLDLDGVAPSELWMRIVFEEGAGDRVDVLSDGGAKGLGPWSCGAGG